MRTSQQGVDLIKKHEGLVLTAYKDPVGVWTIGYGHTGEYAQEGSKISKGKAEALLREDLHEAETAVEELTTVALTQNQFDALVSFVFNVGAGAYAKSTLRRLLNAGAETAAADQFSRWVYGTKDGKKVRLAGLVKRRAEEAALFLEGTGKASSGVIGESAPKGPETTAAAAVGGVAAVAAPLLQAASGATPALVATIFAAVAAAYLIWKLTKEDE
jgi:lysozyme